jgi:hypothetical protein
VSGDSRAALLGPRERSWACAIIAGVVIVVSGVSFRRKRTAGRKKARGLSWREVTGAAEDGCRVGSGDGSRDGLDVLLAGLVVEVLDAPFCRVVRSTLDESECYHGKCLDNCSPGTSSCSSSLANFITSEVAGQFEAGDGTRIQTSDGCRERALQHGTQKGATDRCDWNHARRDSCFVRMALGVVEERE